MSKCQSELQASATLENVCLLIIKALNEIRFSFQIRILDLWISQKVYQ